MGQLPSWYEGQGHAFAPGWHDLVLQGFDRSLVEGLKLCWPRKTATIHAYSSPLRGTAHIATLTSLPHKLAKKAQRAQFEAVRIVRIQHIRTGGVPAAAATPSAAACCTRKML